MLRGLPEALRLKNATRGRVTQIMNLLMLAPAIQEELLFLPRVEQGRGKVCLRDLQEVAAVREWKEQWMMFQSQDKSESDIV